MTYIKSNRTIHISDQLRPPSPAGPSAPATAAIVILFLLLYWMLGATFWIFRYMMDPQAALALARFWMPRNRYALRFFSATAVRGVEVGLALYMALVWPVWILHEALMALFRELLRRMQRG